MQRNDFCVHPLKFAACLFTVAAGVILGITSLIIGEWLGAVLLFLVAGLFTWQGLIYGAWVSVTAEGVRRHILGRTLKQQRWEEIKEVGVVGTKVFNRLHPEKTGSMYIYFSPKALTEQERFQLALDFPPKDMIFLLHNQEREDLVQAFWDTRLIGYNTGSLKLAHPQEDSQES